MAYQPKSYRKFLTGAVSAAVVASAIAPVAASAATSTVKSVYSLHSVTAYKGQSVKSVKLPTKVKVKYTNGKTGYVSVKWSALSTSKTGTKKLTGTLKGTSRKAYVSVVVKTDSIKSVSSLKDVSAYAGVTASLPKTVRVTYYSGKTANAKVKWASVSTSTVGTKTVKGDVLGTSKDATLKVKVVRPLVKGNLATVVDSKHVKVTFATGKVVTVTLAKELEDGATTVDFTYYNNGYRKVKLSAPFAADPVVKSVSAINGTQLLVTFSKAVDSTTAGTVGKYTVTGNSVDRATVQPDGKSVVLTLHTAYDNTTSHLVAVTINGVATAANTSVFFPLYSNTVKVFDTTAPKVTSVTSVTNSNTATSATVNFSEPVVSGWAIIDGGTTKYAVSGSSLNIPSGLSLDSSKTHTVEVVNLTDTAGNVTTDATYNFTVTKDSVAPVISSVSPYNDNKLLVTFSKEMPLDSSNHLANTSGVAIPTTNFVVRDEALGTVGSVASVTALPGDTTGTKFVVDFGATSALYQNSNTRNLQLVVTGTGITDVLGNALSTAVKPVTLTKDVSAPTVTSVTVQKDSLGAATSVTFNYSEPVSNPTGNVTIVDANGVLQAPVSGSRGSDGKSVVVPVSGLTGSISVSYNSGFVTDTALTPNNTAAYSGTVNLGTPNTPTVKYNVSSVGVVGKVITVTFPTAVKGGNSADSATNLSNYTLGGKALPAGTTITLNPAGSPSPTTVAQTIATITLPAGSITADTDAAVFKVNAGIAGLNNSVSNAYTGTINIHDNTAPVLQSARLVSVTGSAATFELTYNEAINQALDNSQSVFDELVFKDNGNVVGTAATANKVAGFTNKVLVTFTGVVNAADTLTITTQATASSADLKDNSLGANLETTGTTVTISK